MRRLIVGASLALALGSVSAVHAGEDRALELLVITAATPEEHAEVARFYAAKARDAREEAVRHHEMGVGYTDGAPTGLEQRREQREHCEKIASLHTEIAGEYEALAMIHSELAGRPGAENNRQSR